MTRALVTALSQELFYPEHGYPARVGEARPPLSAWARLARGGALGKKSVLLYDARGRATQTSPVSILRLQGDDADAQHVTLTLAPPLVVPAPFSPLLAARAQNLTGEQDNGEIVSRGTFPGELAPIAWPPIEAIIEWGVGGTAATVAVDFVNGATVNLVASCIEVRAAITAAPDAIAGTSAAYVLAAWVGPGFARPGVAQKTVQLGVIRGRGESDALPIPRFARSAYVFASDDSSRPALTTATLRFWQSPNRTNNVGNVVVSGQQASSFDIPAGAAYASVRSGLRCGARFSILYNLAI
jgi:hypothetical protein